MKLFEMNRELFVYIPHNKPDPTEIFVDRPFSSLLPDKTYASGSKLGPSVSSLMGVQWAVGILTAVGSERCTLHRTRLAGSRGDAVVLSGARAFANDGVGRERSARRAVSPSAIDPNISPGDPSALSRYSHQRAPSPQTSLDLLPLNPPTPRHSQRTIVYGCLSLQFYLNFSPFTSLSLMLLLALFPIRKKNIQRVQLVCTEESVQRTPMYMYNVKIHLRLPLFHPGKRLLIKRERVLWRKRMIQTDSPHKKCEVKPLQKWVDTPASKKIPHKNCLP